MTARERVRTLVDHNLFQHVVITVIVLNAVVLGCATSPALVSSYGDLLHTLDDISLTVFVAELTLRIYAYGRRFFTDAWNWFDFLVVSVSLLPATGAVSVIRSLRIVRALRLVSVIPSMRKVVTALLKAIPGILSLIALLVLLLYVGAVMATNLFGDTGDPRFDGLGATLLTLFQITTGDGWSDVMRDVMAHQPYAWIFFLGFLTVSAFTLLNLFIAVVCSAMEPDAPQTDEKPLVDNRVVLDELRALRAEIHASRAAR